jgi:hypothetical protein
LTELWEHLNLLFLFTDDLLLKQRIELEYPEFKLFAWYKIKGEVCAWQYIVPKHLRKEAEQLVDAANVQI